MEAPLVKSPTFGDRTCIRNCKERGPREKVRGHGSVDESFWRGCCHLGPDLD